MELAELTAISSRDYKIAVPTQDLDATPAATTGQSVENRLAAVKAVGCSSLWACVALVGSGLQIDVLVRRLLQTWAELDKCHGNCKRLKDDDSWNRWAVAFSSINVALVVANAVTPCCWFRKDHRAIVRGFRAVPPTSPKRTHCCRRASSIMLAAFAALALAAMSIKTDISLSTWTDQLVSCTSGCSYNVTSVALKNKASTYGVMTCGGESLQIISSLWFAVQRYPG